MPAISPADEPHLPDLPRLPARNDVSKISYHSSIFRTFIHTAVVNNGHGIVHAEIRMKDAPVDDPDLNNCLASLHRVRDSLNRCPYSIPLYLAACNCYGSLGYPDLAAGAAYKALLLADAVDDESDEYHEDALTDTLAWLGDLPTDPTVSPDGQSQHILQSRCSIIKSSSQDAGTGEPSHVLAWMATSGKPMIFGALAENLLHCGCLRSAFQQCQRGLQIHEDDPRLLSLLSSVLDAVQAHFKRLGVEPPVPLEADQDAWPDTGLVRRECYPWNDNEPHRFSAESLAFVNNEMAKFAPKLEVRAVDLPALAADAAGKISKQLGVFAKEDLAPGEIILSETSILTANNRLQGDLCDACGSDIDASEGRSVSCEDCYALFCGDSCLDTANASYHPAVCDRDVDSIARDVPPNQAADSLYFLLLLRTLAMSETQGIHPLQLPELKYIWPDYHGLDLATYWRSPKGSDPFANLPQTLPFSFSTSIELPFHLLHKMDINIFTSAGIYDVWIFNTLYAKFRGTASARLSVSSRNTGGLKLGRRPRGPEVSAVHPNWCLANHSCDPNVEWEWGGRVEFRVRKERKTWRRGRGEDGEERVAQRPPGIAKGEEVLSHYCDIELDVHERRAWAKGALGGDCLCERCMWEAGQA